MKFKFKCLECLIKEKEDMCSIVMIFEMKSYRSDSTRKHTHNSPWKVKIPPLVSSWQFK